MTPVFGVHEVPALQLKLLLLALRFSWRQPMCTRSESNPSTTPLVAPHLFFTHCKVYSQRPPMQAAEHLCSVCQAMPHVSILFAGAF